MPSRSGSQSRLGEWKSRNTQVFGASMTGAKAARHSARNLSRAAAVTFAPRYGMYQSSSSSTSIMSASRS